MRMLSLFAVLSVSASAWAADLNIDVSGVKSAEGQIKLMLFDKTEGFRKEASSREVLAIPAAVGNQQAVFKDLPPGRYAAIAYHDENANGKLDLRFGMIPAEGYGLSNNPEVFGPPSFEHASFELDDAGTRIEIRLAY
jgi:uncharacterized protein (DUF2141 family)